ncbi:MAG: isopentenyl phosphate kinase family protein [Chloroflexi bacterium]|nr:isopentenyl phosphate kinase family protein [Chloroflexota bacterium]
MLIFLKLGGSLITDKDQPKTARMDVINRICGEIAAARAQMPHLKIILGHGSGSFGHASAKRFGTHGGVRSREEWLGFAEVWRDARELNQILVEALTIANLPVISFPPSAMVTTNHRKIIAWDTQNIQSALQAGLLPLIMGDVIFDHGQGGTILSTEELFHYLALVIHPDRILFAGKDEGVWEDFPQCQKLIAKITPQTFPQIQAAIQASASVDVTGGMLLKVQSMLHLVQQSPNLKVQIFSGLAPGNLHKALTGEELGTIISSGF